MQLKKHLEWLYLVFLRVDGMQIYGFQKKSITVDAWTV